MFLYKFTGSGPVKMKVDLTGDLLITINGETAPLKDFGDCLLCEEEIEEKIALAVWSAYCER